jgi:hypothetical protein
MHALRKCCECSFEARTEVTLEMFVKDKKAPYGRQNICKKCKNAMMK